MREESGSEEDSDEPVEWEDDDEASSEEDGSEDEVRVSNAQRGRVRLHGTEQRTCVYPYLVIPMGSFATVLRQ